MPRTTSTRKDEILTFRLPPAMKREVNRMARSEKKPVGAFVRDLLRERLDRRKQEAFEAEARRQCLEANAAARDPTTDEYAVMQELDAELDALADE
jgi:Arc/MetJ-type ribon-helix-helix transcriptional regulator